VNYSKCFNCVHDVRSVMSGQSVTTKRVV